MTRNKEKMVFSEYFYLYSVTFESNLMIEELIKNETIFPNCKS